MHSLVMALALSAPLPAEGSAAPVQDARVLAAPAADAPVLSGRSRVPPAAGRVRHGHWPERSRRHWTPHRPMPHHRPPEHRSMGGWRGYRVHPYGFFLPRFWFQPSYIIIPYARYGLAAPADGYRWYRYQDDAVLVDGDGRVWDRTPMDRRGEEGRDDGPNHVGAGVTYDAPEDAPYAPDVYGADDSVYAGDDSDGPYADGAYADGPERDVSGAYRAGIDYDAPDWADTPQSAVDDGAAAYPDYAYPHYAYPAGQGGYYYPRTVVSVTSGGRTVTKTVEPDGRIHEVQTGPRAGRADVAGE